jgi:hypothetical protein
MIGDGYFDLTMFVHSFTSPSSVYFNSPNQSSISHALSPSRHVELTFYREGEFAAFDDFFQQQKAEESRIERERADAELARSLQNDGFAVVNQPAVAGPSAFDRLSGVPPQASSSSFTNPPSSSARTAFDRMSAVHQDLNPSAATSSNRENAHLASSRKLPPGWNNGSSSQPSQYRPVTQYRPVKAEGPSMASGVKMENHYSPFQNPASSSTSSFVPASKVKAEQKYSMPGSFRDDSSTASDSDIEVIPASAFRPNGRQSSTSASQRPGYSPESQAASNAALRRVVQTASNDALQQAMYGNQQLPSWMNAQAGPSQPFGSTMQPSPSMGMGVGMSSAQGQYVYPSAYTPYSGMGVPKQEGGLGYYVTPDGTISLDDDLDILCSGKNNAFFHNAFPPSRLLQFFPYIALNKRDFFVHPQNILKEPFTDSHFLQVNIQIFRDLILMNKWLSSMITSSTTLERPMRRSNHC